MRGIILLDGPDCAGKTTLANEIKRVAEVGGHKADIRHLGKPEAGTCWAMHSEALLTNIFDMLNDNTVIIMDRHFLSEAVYGTVYREGSEYPYTMRFVDMLFNRYRALKVICCPPVDVVVETHAKMKNLRREEYDSGMDKVAALYEKIRDNGSVVPTRSMDYMWQLIYAGGVSETSLWYHYDYTVDGLTDAAIFLLKELEHESWFYGDDTWHYSFNGTPGPLSTLLVGDKISQENLMHIPFFANSDSSLYLAKTLHRIGVKAERLCIANINDEGGAETVRYLANRCKQVIALGRNAERSLQIHDIHYHGQVRHPQHASRFSHNDDSYVAELAKFFV